MSIILLYWISSISGQDLPSVSDAYFFKGAIVTTQPNASPQVLDILVREGLIKAIGVGLTPPVDAHIIKVDSLYIYPGFIAAASHIGVPKPKPNTETPRVKRPGYPPNHIAGITPEQTIEKTYSAKEGSIKQYRKLGFTMAHVMPYGKMLPGQTSVISLNGKDFNQAVITENFGQYAQLSGARRMFPSTKIGVIAKWRELYRNATLTKKHTQAYRSNPQGKRRPNPDEATAALINVVEHKQPVFFHTEKHLDLQRALQLQKELGFHMVATETMQGVMSISKAKIQGVPILISLKLPKEVKSSKDSLKISAADKNLLKRKQASISEYEKEGMEITQENQAGGFSLLKVKPDNIYKNIRRMIKSGMSDQNALAQLTTEPAKLLKIDRITGTIAKGKIANLVVSTKPIFEEKTKIKMVMVDGHIHKYETKEKKKKSSEDVDIAGDWTYTVEVPGMEVGGTIKITKADEGYNLAITNSAMPGQTHEVSNITTDKNGSMSYAYDINMDGITLNLQTEITFDKDTFEGTVSLPDFGTFPMTGSKVETPE